MAWVDGWHSGHLRASLGWDYGTRLINARRRDIEGCPNKASQDILCLSYLPLEILLNWDCYYTLPFSLPAPTTRPGTVALYLYLGFAGLETQHLDSFSQEAIAVRNIPLPLLFHLPQLVDL